ncbi:MarR family transcriptional regulator [Corynebacterium sp. sy017]|uniref:MarR family winged helix-turn-helix transcriptional regulator n=1 Tax=unclassified Corynebacterium TaxID=2624378 RepID=UPI001184DFBC|nr:MULTISPECIES: MarR family transcriptional regulator [unclassified Corynebacterium]MBP3088225.1 MarR family transcriptional regulator [Corynebacterium sp. sy017]QDZ43413.1 MarR family transcriptional regulator [Corynebacterium sp. sy039]TSD91556.1 MarR family transcriptional regulator [Corynebacterium sp. SY003]
MSNLTPYEIAALIRPALTKLHVLYFRVAEHSDLSGPQLTIMTLLAEEGPQRISSIAKAEGIRMPTASNALHQLEERGMIERTRDETDRRGVRVRLTQLGTQELERVGQERNKYLADMLSSLNQNQLSQLEKLADIINELADSYSGAESSVEKR